VLADFSVPLNSLRLPDVWQHQAVNFLREGNDVIVSAPTGAGKTYIFELLHEQRGLTGQAVYTVPTRALANDKHAEWKQRGWDVGIATGDVSENIHAPVVVATLETQVERLLRGQGPAILVIDEYQMIGDNSRGSAYEAAIALAGSETRLLLLSGSVANAKDVAEWMRHLDRSVEVVETKHRPVPLEEMPLDAIQQSLAKRLEGWWPRLAATVMLADLAPLLIFTPRRKDAEKIARILAESLPISEPLGLSVEQRNSCGKELSAMLERRIAFHHSGLSYAARAGIIEPLAKSGQLRVIVATMGLAAGINFSVRSVHVAATQFHNGTQEQRLEPDELLQMFGRAGRRGLDEVGYVITTRESPSLNDARPGKLSRSNRLAWSMFLRVMKRAEELGTDPFAAAERFAQRLFSREPPPLGLEADKPLPNAFQKTEIQPVFGLQAMDHQILNSEGKWERFRARRERTVRLGDCWIAREDRQGHALEFAKYVTTLGKGLGRPAKSEAAQYHLEVALGNVCKNNEDAFQPTRALRRLLKLRREQNTLELEHFTNKHRYRLTKALIPETAVLRVGREFAEDLPSFVTYEVKLGMLYARFDLSSIRVEAYEDKQGRMLVEVLEREVPHESNTGVRVDGEKRVEPRPGSAIHTWRALGLIDERGAPTLRGEIVSFFQGGEGLAIAAALEDDAYGAQELVLHMANLRAGFRFELPGFCESEKLGAASRAAYGFVSHEGYLNAGLPVDYGEGAAEVLHSLLNKENRSGLKFSRDFQEGDVSRAYLEWVSLLRHVTHAPRHSWERWQQFQQACEEALEKHGKALRYLFHLDVPPLTARQRNSRPRHDLLFPSKHSGR
jgi:superfamily II DNA/RNA helicase